MKYTNIHRLNTSLHRFCLELDKGDDPLILFAFANMLIMDEVKAMELQLITYWKNYMTANEGKQNNINKGNRLYLQDYNDLYEDQQILTEQIMMALNINRNLVINMV